MSDKKSERWSKALQRARQSQSLQQLIEYKDAPLRIAKAPIPELYFAIQETGLADASEVLEYITATQLQGFIDLGAWQRDRLSFERCAEWIGAIASVSREKLLQVLPQLDEEWVTLFLRQYITVYDTADEVPETVDEGVEIRMSPDLQSSLVIRDAQDKGALSYLMIEAFFAQEVMLGRRILEALRAELDAGLEEDALRFRNGRLADLGFLSREESIELYAPQDSQKIISEALKREKSPQTIDLELLQHTGLPAPYLEPMEASGPLAEMLSLPGAEEVARRFMLELPTLLNRVLAANEVDPAEMERITQFGKHTRAVLDLGVRQLNKEQLQKLSLREVFRVGWWQVAKLQPRAKRLLSSQVFGWIEQHYRAAVSALARPIPAYSLALSRPPGEGTREFVREEELVMARGALEHAEVCHELIQRMNVSPIKGDIKTSNSPELTMSVLFGTSLANALLGREFMPQPIELSELPTLKERLFEKGDISPEVARSAQETMKSLPNELQDAARKSVSFWLASLVQELSRLDTTKRLEPQFIGGILLRS